MRIGCLITRSFLTRFLDEEVGYRVRSRISAHLDRCDDCKRRVREAHAFRRRIGSLEPPAVSEEEWDGLWSGVLRRMSRGDEVVNAREKIPFPRLRSGGRYAFVAAILALLVGGALVRLWFAGNQPDQTPISSYIQYHENAVDAHVLLEDHFWNAQVLPVSYSTGR